MSGVTAFLEERIIARGGAEAVTRTLEERWPADLPSIRVFDDETGRPVDLDYWDAGAARPALPPPKRARVPAGKRVREICVYRGHDPRPYPSIRRRRMPGSTDSLLKRLTRGSRLSPGRRVWERPIMREPLSASERDLRNPSPACRGRLQCGRPRRRCRDRRRRRR
jgi:hypothetical protein